MKSAILLLSLAAGTTILAAPKPWTPEKAQAWYRNQPWLVGANYIPSNAINELEMWQADTFDAARIDTELGWAESIGMNTMRVFLHDLLWQQDAAGFRERIGKFLGIAAKHHIRPLFVLFDSCWDPDPHTGIQRAPRPGVHNSGWVQSPGLKALEDPSQVPRLKEYVVGVVGAFRNDERILAWDLWNEPDNPNGPYKDPAEAKIARVLELLPQTFAWARSARPRQPLTSGVWKGEFSKDKLGPAEKIQIENSDVISFHNYDAPDVFEKRTAELAQYRRPLLCTEYMARPRGSTFAAILPIMEERRIAAYNWGFVQGKTQTNLPWDSWEHPYTDREPEVWFHDIFHADGKPYRPEEVELIRRLTASARERAKAA